MSAPTAGTREGVATPEQAQLQASLKTWRSGSLLRRYRGRNLRPAERELFGRHAGKLAGRVLELGCGGGRITGHLIERASAVRGVDIAERMVGFCRRRYPEATFAQGDLREPDSWGAGPWDAIVAGWALIDVLDDADRGSFLDSAHRRLLAGGLLIFSSHNLASAQRLKGPLGGIAIDNPVSVASQLLRLPRSVANHRRLARWERREADYAILNPAAHDFSLLHYYISRDAQERQLARHGFELLECVDAAGAEVPRGGQALDSPELHYAARRTEAT